MVNLFDFLSQFNGSLLAIAIIVILIVEVFLLAFPKEVVMVYAGFTFGINLGFALNLLGLLGAAWLGYESGLAGKFGLEKRRKDPILLKYQNWIEERGLKFLIFLRIFPLTPNDILSISSGFASVKRMPYLLITFTTAIPYAILWSWVGANALEAFIILFPAVFDTKTWFKSLLFVVLVFWIIGFYIKNEAKKMEIATQGRY